MRWETAYCLSNCLTNSCSALWWVLFRYCTNLTLRFSVNLTLSQLCRNLSFSVSSRWLSAHFWLISGRNLCTWRNFSPTIHLRDRCLFFVCVSFFFFSLLTLEMVTNHCFLIWNSFINWPRVTDRDKACVSMRYTHTVHATHAYSTCDTHHVMKAQQRLVCLYSPRVSGVPAVKLHIYSYHLKHK